MGERARAEPPAARRAEPVRGHRPAVGPAQGGARADVPGPALVDLQRLAGNRATTELLRRRAATAHHLPPAPHPSASAAGSAGVAGPVGMMIARSVDADRAGAAVVQRDDPSPKLGGGETVEISWQLKELRFGVKVTFKATVSRKGSKIVEAPTTSGPLGTDSAWSLGENKATLEKASGRWGSKITSALARQDFTSGEILGFPGLKFRLTAKGPEGKFDLSKGEVGLDVLKIQGAVDGDFIAILDYAGLAHLKDRVSIKGSLQIEKGISPADLVRLKTALVYSKEAEKAAKQAEEHALKYAKHLERLEVIKKERAGLERKLERRRRALDRATKSLEAAEGRDRYGKPLRKRPSLRSQKAAAEKAVRDAERALLHNKNAARVEGYFMGKASKGLAAAGARLKAAGRGLDAALKKVTDPLAKPIKKAIEKMTAKIMKKLAGTLLAKGLKYLIPGLNLAMTLIDIGTVLFAIFGDSKDGVMGGDGGDDATGTTGGSGSGQGTGGDADAGSPDAGGGASGSSSGTGGAAGGTGGQGGAPGKTPGGPGPTGGGGTTGAPGTAAPPTAQLSPTAKELLEAFHGDPLTLDAETVKMVNDGVPAMTAAEKQKLLERLRAQAPGGTADPYELVVEIQAQLAEIRAGEDTITYEGGTSEAAPAPDAPAAEPPKTLLPFTRADARNILEFDRKQQAFVLKAGFRNFQNAMLPPHPDGLQVKLIGFDVRTTFPSAGRGQAVVSLTFDVEVASLPAGADAGYPYKVGETKQQKMTFLYDPKLAGEEGWSEIDYGHLAQLRSVLKRSGRTWTLTEPGKIIRFQAASVRVERILETREVKAPDGSTVTKFAVEVVPTEIHGKRAGYTTSQGWVDFVKGKPVPITFELPD